MHKTEENSQAYRCSLFIDDKLKEPRHGLLILKSLA